MANTLTLRITLLLSCLTGFASAADIVAEGKSFKWSMTIRDISPDSKIKTLVFEAPVSRARLPISEGKCFLTLASMLKTSPDAKWEQSVNLTCNSFTALGLCRLGDKRIGWVSGVLEGKKKNISINISCDQFDESSYHDSD